MTLIEGRLKRIEGSERVFPKLFDVWLVRCLSLLDLIQIGGMAAKPSVQTMGFNAHALSRKKNVGDFLA